MNPLDFLDLAEKLEFSSSEAEIRTAISRAYYAVYNYIKADLVGLDEYLQHDILINCITETRVERFEYLGKDIRDLMAARRRADYKMGASFTSRTCETIISKSQNIIKEFDECKKLGLIEEARVYLRRFGYIRSM